MVVMRLVEVDVEVVFLLFSRWLALLLCRILLYPVHGSCGFGFLLFVILLALIKGSYGGWLGAWRVFVSWCEDGAWWSFGWHTSFIVRGSVSVTSVKIDVIIIILLSRVQCVLPNCLIWRNLSACIQGAQGGNLTVFLAI